MPVMLPVVTPVPALKAVPCSIHGKPLLATVKVRPSGVMLAVLLALGLTV